MNHNIYIRTDIIQVNKAVLRCNRLIFTKRNRFITSQQEKETL